MLAISCYAVDWFRVRDECEIAETDDWGNSEQFHQIAVFYAFPERLTTVTGFDLSKRHVIGSPAI